jgi:hypothetical protein
MALDPHIYASLSGMTTTRLAELVDRNVGDAEQLKAVLATLIPRTGDNSIKLRGRVEDLLERLPAPPQIEKPWYLRPATYVIGLVGTLAVGVGHGAGAEIWKFIWPQVQRFLY